MGPSFKGRTKLNYLSEDQGPPQIPGGGYPVQFEGAMALKCCMLAVMSAAAAPGTL